MLSSKKNLNPVQSLAVVAVALSQCWMLSACGSKATLARATISALKHSNAPGSNRSQTPPTAQIPNGSSAPAGGAAATSFAASLASVDFDADAAHGVVHLNFTSVTANQSSTFGPLIAQLSAATSAAGADMTAPPGVLGYSAHVACQNAACSDARITLIKQEVPLQGQAVITVHGSTPASVRVTTDGTPTDLHAKVASALNSQGVIETQITLKQVENGATFFKIDCRVPHGAIVPGHPVGDNGRQVILTGQLGTSITLGMSYVDTDDHVASRSHENFDGVSAQVSEDHTLRLTFTGANRIRSMEFGEPARSH